MYSGGNKRRSDVSTSAGRDGSDIIEGKLMN